MSWRLSESHSDAGAPKQQPAPASTSIAQPIDRSIDPFSSTQSNPPSEKIASSTRPTNYRHPSNHTPSHSASQPGRQAPAERHECISLCLRQRTESRLISEGRGGREGDGMGWDAFTQCFATPLHRPEIGAGRQAGSAAHERREKRVVCVGPTGSVSSRHADKHSAESRKQRER